MKRLIEHISPLTRRAVRAWHHVSAPVAFVVALVVGLLSFGMFAQAEVAVGPARVKVDAAASFPGRTVLSAPPFGSVSAPTHPAPMRLDATLSEVDVPGLQRLAGAGVPSAETLDEYQASLTRGAWEALAKGLLAAAFAAAFVGWSLRHRLWVLGASTALGFAVPAILVAWTALSFDPAAFQRPAYEGALTYAPSLVQLVQERAQTVEGARAGVSEFARELAGYYASPMSFGSGGAMENTFRVLHVSDLHMDPVGLQLQQDLIDRFDIGLVINTGDAVSYGSDVEAGLAVRSIVPTVPLVYVPGNHDSAIVTSQLRAAGVEVLDSSSAAIEGINVFGVADPVADESGWEPDADEARAAGIDAAEDLRARLEAGEATPTIVATHEPATAEAFNGLVPLVAAGHTHTPQLEERDGTWQLNSGTTGGVHFSRLRPDPHIPHSAAILYYTAELPRRLIAIDQIQVDGQSEQFSLQRTVIDQSLLPPVGD